MTRPAAGRAERIREQIASTSLRRVPRAPARSLARWITGPSASGSLKGTPSSITCAPASMAASAISRVASRLGSPAVRYTISPGLGSKWSAIGNFQTPQLRVPQVPVLEAGIHQFHKLLQLQLTGKYAHILVAAS